MSTATDSRADHLRRLADDYLAEHGNEPSSLNDLFVWARAQNRWEPAPKSLVRQFKEEMRRALRDDYYTDPQGREVRKKHAVIRMVDGKQLSFWADIGSAPPDHMHVSLQQRRRGMLRDVLQAKVDMDSYNQNNNPDPEHPIQLSFNFDEDLAEIEHAETYPEGPPEEDDD